MSTACEQILDVRLYTCAATKRTPETCVIPMPAGGVLRPHQLHHSTLGGLVGTVHAVESLRTFYLACVYVELLELAPSTQHV